ncbi:MAG: tRNA (guanosine(46)-N7)-methyltransferase TrmB [Sedimentisphaerales bacterium]|nr:tRNA (guanosine(46)-N7)-methyltransferase TrmB [Sedimentisphaerales bacterium]
MLVHMKKRVLRDYGGVSVHLEVPGEPIDFEAMFGRIAPIQIEIGSGKGTFLLAQARNHPQMDFLGIEWANKYYRYTVDRIGRWGLNNVRMVRIDAATFVREYLSEASVDVFHIYFPDPWPKKRHHKRRFFQGSNISELQRVLKPGGVIQFVTDHSDYFEQIRQELASGYWRLKPTRFVPTAAARDGEWVGTNYERKYLRQKKPIYKLAFYKA